MRSSEESGGLPSVGRKSKPKPWSPFESWNKKKYGGSKCSSSRKGWGICMLSETRIFHERPIVPNQSPYGSAKVSAIQVLPREMRRLAGTGAVPTLRKNEVEPCCGGTPSPPLSIEPTLKFIGATTPCSSVMGNLVEAAQVVRLFLEVWDSVSVGQIPNRTDQGQERRLAGAVFAYQQRQGREASGLLLSEAAEVLECYAVHGRVSRRLCFCTDNSIAPGGCRRFFGRVNPNPLPVLEEGT